MVIEKPKLFLEKKDFVLFVLFMFCVISLRLFYTYQSYESFVSKPFYYTTAKVLNAYPKSRNGKTYTVLKLRSDGLTFFTSTYRNDALLGKDIRLKIYPTDRIGFIDYLGYFYVKSQIKNIESTQTGTKDMLLKRVSVQHSNSEMASFYNAIFFASALSKELREKIAGLGISHLVALSGFHLGILWGLIYGILLFLYKPFQKRYFPYRFTLIDMGFLTIVLLGVYVWFVDFPPSLVRSYAMVLVGWIIVLLGMELLSFIFLTTIALLLLALFPSLLVSLGFWLSVAGVFYIFLILQYSKELKGWIISALLIPFGIFIFMLPVVHFIFGVTTVYQLLSPLLSLLFIPFYPLAMLLHIVGIGDLLDNGLLWLFGLSGETEEHILPLSLFILYVGLSILAIWSKKVFYILLGMALLYLVYLFV
ncbi:MAG: ComEC/Rec2 family competence protein [Sulfurovum sp.]|nr:ComEC/Rec2 family competence protein [Sulfurovum sp.]